MRLRFTIRDLLWLVALIAVGLGWWVDHRELSKPPVYAVTVRKEDDFVITKTGDWVFRIDKNERGHWQGWHREGQSWIGFQW